MSLNHLKSWSFNQKVTFSLLALLVMMLFFGAFVTLFVQDDLQSFQQGEIGEKITALTEKMLDGNENQSELFKGVNDLIKAVDSSKLNSGFYIQIVYNLIVFLGVSLLLGKVFLPKGIHSFTFKNKAPILFIASFVVAVNIQIIGSDALKLNEILGLDQLQEYFTGTDKFDDLKNMITQYMFLLPNEHRGWLITLIGVALIPAVGEEFMFRGYLMKLLSSKFNHHNGIALSGLLFALIHFNLTNFFYYFVLGVVLGYMYYWGRNLLFPIIVHFINNALVVIVYLESISTGAIQTDDALDYSLRTYSIMAYASVALCLVIFFMNYKRNKFIVK
ncbi:MAG: hypothetical protein CMP61_11985 [Flavobacteriales bacterium]|nr:hypothetical protein [Flavobacteriales bacterium]|tara:strand:- start:27311 stop:28306 length:996 start_codon:yes stop_codon:yes gene_type:complete